VAGRLRVGLVGGGPWAQRVHAPAIAAHRDFELTGVWTRRPAVAGELAAAHGAIAFEDLDALIDAVDLVALSVPPAVQPDVAIVAARAGRHVILEKPIADSVDRAEQLAQEIATAGVASVVVLTFRFAPETRDWLANTAAGGPWSGGNARWLSGALLGGDFAGSPWRQENGALLDIGPHLFDLLDAALGTITEVRSASFTEPDVWHVVCAHESGAVSTASLSMRLPIDPSVLEFDVYGDGGRVALSARRTPAPECFRTLLDELAAVIRSGGAAHPCDVRRGLHVQRIIARVREVRERAG
jgi:predicted dehydrogenase